MIVVTGEIEVAAADRDAAIAAMSAMTAETLKEQGCIAYRFWSALDAPGLFHVYEEWESLAHLDAHGQAAHMEIFRDALGRIGVLRRAVKRMEAGPAVPL